MKDPNDVTPPSEEIDEVNLIEDDEERCDFCFKYAIYEIVLCHYMRGFYVPKKVNVCAYHAWDLYQVEGENNVTT